MKKITYIIPIHKIDDAIETMVKNAYTSIKNMASLEDDKVMFVGPKTIIEKAVEACGATDAVMIENDETDFYTQINKAALQCTTPYFSILEFDDEYVPYWKEKALEYAENGASILLPLVELRRDGKMVAFANEVAWSSIFANQTNNELGYIDNDCLNDAMDFNVTGALIKTEDFISLGCLKPSLKIAAWYEFLNRAAKNSKYIYVVPVIGYYHTIDREDSYMVNAGNEITADEARWLINTAKQEYFFKEDRNRKFGEDNPDVE